MSEIGVKVRPHPCPLIFVPCERIAVKVHVFRKRLHVPRCINQSEDVPRDICDIVVCQFVGWQPRKLFDDKKIESYTPNLLSGDVIQYQTIRIAKETGNE